jgi:hypothetical protein
LPRVVVIHRWHDIPSLKGREHIYRTVFLANLGRRELSS